MRARRPRSRRARGQPIPAMPPYSRAGPSPGPSRHPAECLERTASSCHRRGGPQTPPCRWPHPQRAPGHRNRRAPGPRRGALSPTRIAQRGSRRGAPPRRQAEAGNSCVDFGTACPAAPGCTAPCGGSRIRWARHTLCLMSRQSQPSESPLSRLRKKLHAAGDDVPTARVARTRWRPWRRAWHSWASPRDPVCGSSRRSGSAR